MKDIRIEFPSVGTTYSRPEYGVYEYSEYEDWSVLAGRERRVWLAGFVTLAEAVQAYPDADSIAVGPGFREDRMLDLPGDDDPDPFGDNRREHGGAS